MKSENINDFFAAKEEKTKKIKIEAPIMPPARKREAIQAVPEKKAGFFAKISDFLLKLSIFMIFLGLPLYLTGLSFQGTNFEKQVYFYFWVLLGLVAWASKGVLEESMKVKKTPLDIPIIIFWVISLASVVFSVDRWHSLWGFFGDPSRGFLSLSAIIVFYYLYLSNFSAKIFKLSFIAFLFSGLLVAVYTLARIMEFGFIPAAWLEKIPVSLVGSLENLSVFLGILILFSITAVFKLQSSAKMNPFSKHLLTAFALVNIALNLFILAALGAHVFWWGLFLGLAVFLIFMLSKIIQPQENWTWLPMLVFVLMLVIILSIKFPIAKMEFPQKTPNFYGMSWEIAKNSIKNNFVIGTGPATYGYDFSLHRPASFNLSSFYEQTLSPRFYQAAGILFEMVPTVGLLGTLAFLLVLFSYFGTTGYLLLRGREMNKIYSLGIFCSMIVFLVALFFTRVEGSLLILGGILGILSVAAVNYESGAEENHFTLTLKASPKFALTMAFIFMVVSAGVIFMFVFISKAYVADVYAAKGSLLTGGKVTPELVSNIEKAVSFNGREGRYYSSLGLEYMILVNNQLAGAKADADQAKIIDYYNRAIENTGRGLEMMKNDVVATEAMAQVYENVGLYVSDKAAILRKLEELYKKCSELEPNNPIYYLKLGQIKIRLAELSATKDKNGKSAISEEGKILIEEARNLFQKAVDKKKNYAPAYYQLALADKLLGQLDGAVSNMETAFLLNNSIDYAYGLAALYQERGTKDDNVKAEVIFKKILGVNNKEVITHLNLAQLYENTGRKSEALAEYEKLLELVPENSQAEIQKKINSLKGISAPVEIPEEGTGAQDENTTPAEEPANP